MIFLYLRLDYIKSCAGKYKISFSCSLTVSSFRSGNLTKLHPFFNHSLSCSNKRMCDCYSHQKFMQ